MTERQKELLESLLDLALGYYTEKTDDGSYIIPYEHKERQFIQEVVTSCIEILER